MKGLCEVMFHRQKKPEPFIGVALFIANICIGITYTLVNMVLAFYAQSEELERCVYISSLNPLSGCG